MAMNDSLWLFTMPELDPKKIKVLIFGPPKKLRKGNNC